MSLGRDKLKRWKPKRKGVNIILMGLINSHEGPRDEKGDTEREKEREF